MEENKIKENEIRIGNWFHHKKEWSYRQDDDIKEFDFQFEPSDWFALGECTLFYENFEPILLTEEWLLKFGFNCKYKSVHNHWNLGSFCIEQKSDEDDFGNSIPQEQIFYYNFQSEIKYVHQLQNLYFVLTEKELKWQMGQL